MSLNFSPRSIRVILFSYNHQDFILEALKSINMQITSHLIRITIYDDCSTDKTREIIQSEMVTSPFEWQLIVPAVNQFTKINKVTHNFISSAQEDFIVLLNGDDYWTDPLKLQKQADKLIANENSNLCHHTFYVVQNRKILYEWPPPSWRYDMSGNELSRENFIGLLTVMFRRSAYIKNVPKNQRRLRIGDYHIWALLTQNSKILFIEDVMSNYRIHDSNYFANLSKIDQLGFIVQSKIFTACNVSGELFNLWFESIAADLISLETLKNSGFMFKDANFEQVLGRDIKKLFLRSKKIKLLHRIQKYKIFA